MAYDEDSSGSGHDEPWIQWFCGLKGHEMFCEVERAYIEDGFNLYGLRASVPNFSDCLDLILDRIGPDDSDDSHLTYSACTLYGLIHARYIITAHGLDAMYNKYIGQEFGTCPLLQCIGHPVLPIGVKDDVGAGSVKVFCPKCQAVYHPPPSRSRGGSTNIDGASFGTTFPHLFLMTFSNLLPETISLNTPYVPRVFGFRVHQSARKRGGQLLTTSKTNKKGSRGGNVLSTTAANALGNSKSTKSKASLTDSNVIPSFITLDGYQEGEAHQDDTKEVGKNSLAKATVKKAVPSSELLDSTRNKLDMKDGAIHNIDNLQHGEATESISNKVDVVKTIAADTSSKTQSTGNGKRKQKIYGDGKVSPVMQENTGNGSASLGDGVGRIKMKRQKMPSSAVT